MTATTSSRHGAPLASSRDASCVETSLPARQAAHARPARHPRHAMPDTFERRPALRVRVVVVTLLASLAALGGLGVLEADVHGTTAAAVPLHSPAPASPTEPPAWVITPLRVEVPDLATPFGHRQTIVQHGEKVGWTTQFRVAASDERTLLVGAATQLTATGWQVTTGRHDVFAVRELSHRAEMVKAVTDCTGGRTACTLNVLYASRQTS